MKWFKHDTDARNDVRLKLLKKRFGAEGYGVYFQLLEVIGEFVEQTNIAEWGMVDKFHSVETLSEECSVPPAKLREILKYCNELGLFEKKNERLYCEKITKRLDNFFDRVRRDKSNTHQVRSEAVEPKKKTQVRGSTMPNSIGDVLKNRPMPTAKQTPITKPWQEKAFREMDYIGVRLLPKDTGRVLKIYKEEAEGKQHKAMTSRVISYIKDHPGGLSYDGKLKMFFKLITNGFVGFAKGGEK